MNQYIWKQTIYFLPLNVVLAVNIILHFVCNFAVLATVSNIIVYPCHALFHRHLVDSLLGHPPLQKMENIAKKLANRIEFLANYSMKFPSLNPSSPTGN